MTALETMASAYEFEREQWFTIDRSDSGGWQVLRQKDGDGRYTVEASQLLDQQDADLTMISLRGVASQRAALSALAECDIPDGAALAGLAAADAEVDSIRSIFRAILRALIEESK